MTQNNMRLVSFDLRRLVCSWLAPRPPRTITARPSEVRLVVGRSQGGLGRPHYVFGSRSCRGRLATNCIGDTCLPSTSWYPWLPMACRLRPPPTSHLIVLGRTGVALFVSPPRRVKSVQLCALAAVLRDQRQAVYNPSHAPYRACVPFHVRSGSREGPDDICLACVGCTKGPSGKKRECSRATWILSGASNNLLHDTDIYEDASSMEYPPGQAGSCVSPIY